MPNNKDKPTLFRADSSNLPEVDTMMILEYAAVSGSYGLAEIKGAKALMSTGSYLDPAVGFVELGRSSGHCMVKAKIIVPEPDIGSKIYSVSVKIDEAENTIFESGCDDCAGGCKHSLLLLFWLAKKNDHPSSSYESYWVKPFLITGTEPVTLKELFPSSKRIKLAPKDPNVLKEFREECRRRGITSSLIMMNSDD